MKLIVHLQRVRIDQKDQRGALPFINGAYDAQHITAPPRRQERCVGQQVRPIIIQQTQGCRIGTEIDKGGRYVSHRPAPHRGKMQNRPW
jgi:hypothetical protein